MRRSKRLRGGSEGQDTKPIEPDPLVPLYNSDEETTVVEKGKQKVVAPDASVSEERDRTAMPVGLSDDEDDLEASANWSKDARRGTGHDTMSLGENSGRGKKRDRRGKEILPRNVNVLEADALDVGSSATANAPDIDPSRPHRNSLPNAHAMEATKSRFLEIARRRAAHFAHFTGEDNQPLVPSADGINSVDGRQSPALELFARASEEHVRPRDSQEGVWPGPFIIARQLVEGRAAAAIQRQESSRVGRENAELSVDWKPSRLANFRKNRDATSLYDKCVEVLCANFEHVQSLVGVPEAAKKRISTCLCAQRMMTPASLRLFFESEPADVVVPDCTLITEQTLTEAINCCQKQKLEVLDLGMCGRCLTDQLCETLSTLPVLRTLVLKGAYRLSDNGLRALVHAAPELLTLKLSHCNMISVAGVQALTDCIGSTLKALSLENCSRLEAFKVLPSLLKMTSLQSLSLCGISGMSDGLMSELVVVLGPHLRELYISDCRDLTDASIRAVSLCCSHLTHLDTGHIPLLTDKCLGSLANGAMFLKTLRLNRGKFSDTALAAFVTASGNCLQDLSLNSVRQAGDNTLSALADHSKGTLERLDLSFCRALNDKALGLLADSCSGLREIRLFGCTQVTELFLDGHSNPALSVIGLQGSNSVSTER